VTIKQYQNNIECFLIHSLDKCTDVTRYKYTFNDTLTIKDLLSDLGFRANSNKNERLAFKFVLVQLLQYK
jgi:hypothetical protein